MLFANRIVERMAGHPAFPHNIDKILGPKKKRIGIWVRKPEAEIASIKAKLKKSSYSLTMPITVLILALFISNLAFNQLGKSGFLFGLIISISASILTYISQRIIGRSFSLSPSYKICNNCFKEDRIGLKSCTCGGIFEPPDYYDFIENDK